MRLLPSPLFPLLLLPPWLLLLRGYTSIPAGKTSPKAVWLHLKRLLASRELCWHPLLHLTANSPAPGDSSGFVR